MVSGQVCQKNWLSSAPYGSSKSSRRSFSEQEPVQGAGCRQEELQGSFIGKDAHRGLLTSQANTSPP